MDAHYVDFKSVQSLFLQALVNLSRSTPEILEIQNYTKEEVSVLSNLDPQTIATLSNVNLPMFSLVNNKNFFDNIVPAALGGNSELLEHHLANGCFSRGF